MSDRICSLSIRGRCPIEARKGCDGCSSYITLEEYGKLVHGESNEEDSWRKQKCTSCGYRWNSTKFGEVCPECGSIFVIPGGCD